jgi:hypothetical protein
LNVSNNVYGAEISVDGLDKQCESGNVSDEEFEPCLGDLLDL